MKNKNFRTDLAFISVIVLMFLYFIFLIYQQEYLLDNFLIACVVFIILMITYFSNLTTGLIINAIVILGFITFVIYQNLSSGIIIRPYIYFWIIMSPTMTTAISLFSMGTIDLQKEVERLTKKLVSLSTIDESTNLKNLRAFENDANVYMKVAKRYDTNFGVLLLEYKYQKELERLCDSEDMQKITLLVIDVIRKNLRTEDEIYQLDNKDILFGILLLTHEDGRDIIVDKLKENIAKIDTNDVLNTKQIVLDMRIGVAYQHKDERPLELIEKAKDEMRFDV